MVFRRRRSSTGMGTDPIPTSLRRKYPKTFQCEGHGLNSHLLQYLLGELGVLPEWAFGKWVSRRMVGRGGPNALAAVTRATVKCCHTPIFTAQPGGEYRDVRLVSS
ncbi:hypothetical protein HanPSC8_Chr12g0521181 [Helianthus annuus]|nr:hypothetical protein HanPSC8_Chr12g0521181 [Helianthus annuus]